MSRSLKRVYQWKVVKWLGSTSKADLTQCNVRIRRWSLVVLGAALINLINWLVMATGFFFGPYLFRVGAFEEVMFPLVWVVGVVMAFTIMVSTVGQLARLRLTSRQLSTLEEDHGPD